MRLVAPTNYVHAWILVPCPVRRNHYYSYLNWYSCRPLYTPVRWGSGLHVGCEYPVSRWKLVFIYILKCMVMCIAMNSYEGFEVVFSWTSCSTQSSLWSWPRWCRPRRTWAEIVLSLHWTNRKWNDHLGVGAPDAPADQPGQDVVRGLGQAVAHLV